MTTENESSKPVRTGASARLTKIAADLIRASYDDVVERMAAALGNASLAVKREADLLLFPPETCRKTGEPIAMRCVMEDGRHTHFPLGGESDG